MSTTVPILVTLCLASSSLAASKQRVRIIDGKAVVGGEKVAIVPMVRVENLAAYRCILEENAEPCSVITGQLISLLPSDKFDVIIYLYVHRTSPVGLGYLGTATVTVTRPEQGKPVPFYGLGPAIPDPEGLCVSLRFDWRKNKKPPPVKH